jgi:predicted nucleic acid-binding protein
MYLIDTVVLSELRKIQRDPGVVAWFEQQRTTDLFVSVISIGEIERGITRQHTSDPGFAAALAAWLDRVLVLYGEQILPFDLKTARRWGRLSAGMGNDSTDLMIAGTALEHGLTVVTRNVSDFEPTGVPVLNPFKPRPRRGHGGQRDIKG